MNILNHLVIISSIWVIFLFVSLPLFIEAETNPEQGHCTGAPKVHYLRAKILTTLTLAFLIEQYFYKYFELALIY
ncbi:MAG: DUF1467 family protein [Alphaproteobacteria bacterium]|nr:DUF1467 family protein [Alphaproteobacteria bacterium]